MATQSSVLAIDVSLASNKAKELQNVSDGALLESISPSSTLDLLPTVQKRPQPLRRQRFSNENYAITIQEDGRAFAVGASSLTDAEGNVFVGHLGCCNGADSSVWAEQPVAAPTEVIFPESVRGQVIEVAGGDAHSLFLLRDGSVWSAGSGVEGEHGHGTRGAIGIPRALSSLINTLVPISRIAAGSAHSLALDERGRTYSWGWGRHGQCGHGDIQTVLEPRAVAGLSEVVITQIAAGRAHSLALSASGHLYSFGSQVSGQCGHGVSGADAPKQTVPRVVEALASIGCVRAIFAAADLSAAVVEGSVSSAAMETASTCSDLFKWGGGMDEIHCNIPMRVVTQP